ncbi:serine/threonine-protein kinase [Acrasis kona]|uniref:Serine/threonine-protein kinase n=1 Tax=Acrasis kona TaxID=1008807 RepID=A0AAW2Z0A5_9EUKA
MLRRSKQLITGFNQLRISNTRQFATVNNNNDTRKYKLTNEIGPNEFYTKEELEDKDKENDFFGLLPKTKVQKNIEKGLGGLDKFAFYFSQNYWLICIALAVFMFFVIDPFASKDPNDDVRAKMDYEEILAYHKSGRDPIFQRELKDESLLLFDRKGQWNKC